MVGLLLAYLFFWPVTADPAIWESPNSPSLTGPFEPNHYLKDAKIFGLNDGVGPEDVAIDEVGNIYAGYEDGRIIKYDVNGKKQGVFVDAKRRGNSQVFVALRRQKRGNGAAGHTGKWFIC